MNNSIQYESPIGQITVERSDKGIARLDITSPASEIAAEVKVDDLLSQCKRELSEYFSGHRKFFDLPLDWSRMTAFQMEVLRSTLEIPFGETRTYGELARALGKPSASRAVGSALGRNPLPLLIPCHRVIAASGALTGYSAAGGIATKAWLLQLEGHQIVGKKLG